MILLAAAAVLYTFGVVFCQRAEENMGLTHVLLSQSVDRGAAERIVTVEAEEEAPIRFCFWGQTGEETVSCPINGARAAGNGTLLAGYPELMGAGSLSWQKGCFMDENTARTLFGTTRCGSQVISWNGEEYPVLDTVSGALPRLLRLVKESDGSVLDRCALSLPAEQGRVQGEAFLLRHGLQGKLLDYYPLWAVTKNLRLLFPGLLLLTAWAWLRKGWRSLSISGIRGGEQIPLLLKTILSLGLTAATIWLLGRQVVIPSDMIPSRWSDFSFWGTWWDRQKENFFLLLSTAPGREQLQMMGNMVKSMICTTAAFGLSVQSVRGVHHADIAD